jgi:hypothetical protein
MGRRRYGYDDRYDEGGYYPPPRRGYSGRRRDRRSEERRVELMTFMSVVILCVVMYVNYPQQPHLSPRWVTVIGGCILLGSGFIQASRRWRVNPMTWVGGAVMLTVGIISLQPGSTPASLPLGLYFPILAMGGVLLASFITGEL